MEKKHLLKEMADLRRVIKNYENSRSTGSITIPRPSEPLTSKTKVKRTSDQNMAQNKSIFVNPNKLDGLQAENLLESKAQKGLIDYKIRMKKGSVKMFINPNFKTPTSVLSSHDELDLTYGRENNQQKEAVTSKSNSVCESSARSLQKLSYYQNQKLIKQETLLENRKSKLPLQNSSSLPCTYHRIFINPVFTKSLNLKNCPTSVSSPKLLKIKDMSIEKDQEEEIKVIKLVEPSKLTSTSSVYLPNCSLSGNPSRKRKMVLNEVKQTSSSCKRKKLNEDSNTSGKKIFLNPKFKRVLQVSKAEPGSESDSSTVPKHHSSLDVCEVPLLSSSFQQNTILEKNQLYKSASALPLSKGTLNDPTHGKDNGKQVVAQKIRSRRSSIVSLTRTKLVRKRKLSQSIPQTSSKVSSRNVFLSKTKLVRFTPSIRQQVSNTTEKNKVKRVVPRGYLQCLTPDKINKLRKQSFVNSIKKLVNVTPKSPAVTKIKSKNGKSLKILRKNVQSSKPISDSKVKYLSQYQQRNRYILKEHAVKSALCVINNKLKKTQFTKINVSLKKKVPNQSLDNNKYFYKNKDTILKKNSLKGEALCKWRLSVIKNERFNSSLEHKRLLRSKYKLVRKQGTSSASKNSNKEVKAVPSTSKRKWKLQNRVPKKTRKRDGLTIVNIGGVFYRCSPTSLTRNKPMTKKDCHKQQDGHLLYIKGQKFQLDNKGQTLTCLEKKLERKRIDIGGVTFISSSSGTSLTRTNYHTARSILLQAKQKSISLLTRKLKKNNEPCLFFHRFGRCSGKEKGTCVRQHDPKFIAVCKKFVQGLCEESQCPLSHVISCHNMPTCQHYLAGHCGRDHCPYPHIKVNDCVPLCLDFLKGFCPLGDKCAKRHIEICPSFEKGVCSRGKYCPYPHPKSKPDKLKGKFKNLKSKSEALLDPVPVSNSNLRYFEDINLQKEKELIKEAEKTEENCISESEDRSQPVKKRPQLGRLPSFIPLSLDDY